MAREVPLDHEIRNDHLVEQRWAGSKQFCDALENDSVSILVVLSAPLYG
jgi:hypothetical protein